MTRGNGMSAFLPGPDKTSRPVAQHLVQDFVSYEIETKVAECKDPIT